MNTSNVTVWIATGDELDGLGSIPDKGDIFVFSKASRPALGPTQPPIQWVLGALSPRVKRPGGEAGHPHLSSTEVKNGGAAPLLPHMSSWHSP
jgi:hypothetical protein